MKTSESISAISKSLIVAQTELKNTHKSKKGYGYNYSPLDEILDTVKPVLSKHRLAIIQTSCSKENMIGICTRLVHESGEFIEDVVYSELEDKTKMNVLQKAGSAITYLRRYSITSMLNISSDEDTDGSTQKREETTSNNREAECDTKVMKKINDSTLSSSEKQSYIKQYMSKDSLKTKETFYKSFILPSITKLENGGEHEYY